MKTENKAQPGQGNSEALSSAAAARRQMLLKGLSRGSAVLVASVPLQTLASGSVFTDPAAGIPVRCSLSGQMSGVGSRVPDAVCNGYSPGYWKFPAKHPWPSPADPNTPCKDIFSGCTLMMPGSTPHLHVPASLVYVMLHDSNTDYFHWIGAWLNGLAQTPGFNYPYSGDEILAFYNGTGPYSAAQALAFIKQYLEVHP
ncbi:MAG: hypothetical protein V4447_10395 [Pseudomonadota bacterium]